MYKTKRMKWKKAVAVFLAVSLCFTAFGMPVTAKGQDGILPAANEGQAGNADMDAEQTISGGDAVEPIAAKDGVSSGDAIEAVASEGGVSGGDAAVVRMVQVCFDTTYGEGFYSIGEEWKPAMGTVEIPVDCGETFRLELKTEDSYFISGYSWNDGEQVYCNAESTYLVVSAVWEQLSENSSLRVVFDKKMSAGDFRVTFTQDMGTLGDSTDAVLRYIGESQLDLDGVQVVWGSSFGDGFSAAGQTAGEGELESCKYFVKANEDREVYATASLYRNGVLLAKVESSRFRMVKDNVPPEIREVLYSVNGGDFRAFSGNGRIWGCGKITFRVKAEDMDTDGPASGLKQVSLLVNGNVYNMLYDDESGYYEYTVNRRLGQVFRFQVQIDAFDNAGNHVLEENCPEFGIDNKGPEVQVVLEAAGQEVSGWYSETVSEIPLQFDILIKDDNKAASVEIATQRDFAEDSIVYTGAPVEERDCYTLKTPEGLLTDEQNRIYYIRATDEFGNVSDVVQKLVQIDNTAPQREVLVGFTGTNEMQVQVSGGDAASQTYIVEKGEGVIYDHDKIAMRLQVRDDIANGKEENVSGIYAVDFTILITTKNGVTALSKHVEEEQFVRDEEGNLFVCYEAEIPDGTRVYEQSFQVRDIFITDKAGNACPAEVGGNKDTLGDLVLYVMDNQAPEIVYSYSSFDVAPANVVESAEGKLYYYAQPFSGEVKITDMNLEIGSIWVSDVDGCDESDINQVSRTEENMLWKEVSYSYGLLCDGSYRIVSQADDILHNAMSEDGLLTVYSDIMIVDTKQPRITLTLTDENGQVYETYGDKFFAQDMTANLLIEDRNLDISTVAVSITGKTADGEAFTDEIPAEAWEKTGDIYTGSYSFSQEGQYRILISCRDFAGNEAEKVGESFAIDKTAPTVEVVFDNMDAKNEFYYNADRTAVITVKDYSFDEQDAEFIINSLNGNQVVSETWEHHGAEGCDGEHHTSECTYTSDVQFKGDDVYDFSFKCTDKAGLESELCAGGHFVVDKTAPVVRITYSNGEAKNEFYFRTPRTAYVTVSDLSFAESGVVINKAEGEDVDALPAFGHFGVQSTGHVLAIPFADDGVYRFTVEITDLAGNTSNIEYSEFFIVDTTAPVLEFGGVSNMSANNGIVQPTVTYGDKYLNEGETLIIVEGAKNGILSQGYDREGEEEGYRLIFNDFAYTKETDDLYTLSARIEDYAGNVTEQSILFSVNRFGSVYVLGDGTKQWVEQYYSNKEEKLVITEINVDDLSYAEITCSRDGEIYTLTREEDYTVEKEGSDATWKSYTYRIDKDNFTEEGHYVVTLFSMDEAGNHSDNRVKGIEIAFAIDKTAPSVVVEGVEQDGIYKQENLKIMVDVQDNMNLENMDVLINGAVYQSFDRQALETGFGIVTFEIGESDAPMDISIVATDAAENSSMVLYENVTVSTNIRVIKDAAETAKSAGFAKRKSYLAVMPAALALFLLSVGTIAVILRRRKRG